MIVSILLLGVLAIVFNVILTVWYATHVVKVKMSKRKES